MVKLTERRTVAECRAEGCGHGPVELATLENSTDRYGVDAVTSDEGPDENAKEHEWGGSGLEPEHVAHLARGRSEDEGLQGMTTQISWHMQSVA